MPKGIHTVDLDSRLQTGRDSEIALTKEVSAYFIIHHKVKIVYCIFCPIAFSSLAKPTT